MILNLLVVYLDKLISMESIILIRNHVLIRLPLELRYLILNFIYHSDIREFPDEKKDMFYVENITNTFELKDLYHYLKTQGISKIISLIGWHEYEKMINFTSNYVHISDMDRIWARQKEYLKYTHSTSFTITFYRHRKFMTGLKYRKEAIYVDSLKFYIRNFISSTAQCEKYVGSVRCSGKCTNNGCKWFNYW